ncbi:glucose-6-phosphate dehydrogenase [Chlamydia pecorum]|uniref:Glucose-6-phosphate 1-dehydrogenase n=1 Tax=Chlamydia pecorum (strain ATCC VR-628 / DSM 29919 / E58) TaxID=331635 RepID=A0AA34RDS2_CHLPE|nr:glucose-6-phosphate dehydrogenase [Chlamydia pecorum]AEB41839.1 glucose-6-phosphate 1-dehydrogenase [Chlamydia pecorum E58]ETF37591.1 glucose-6-phosphate 1-dehydrogenase [Chlamydia pecorum VR629]ETF40338.1 glucose-6-phosphate 1-dehydrogenase [Chlamydia pecorum IPTaLE]UFP06476.1 glucose-6-phosphate dehydrogenase [Chlamydia pecorum]UJT77191.1 glucose-6-phosphate 1-dehydrogenase [Chlamydia pecorum]
MREQNDSLDEAKASPCCPPCVMIIFGATGDLTARKLLPALYHLTKEGRLSKKFVCVGFARREQSHEQFRDAMKHAITMFSSSSEIDIKVWEDFQSRIFYHRSAFDDPSGYSSLREFLKKIDELYGTEGNRVFYLSTPPQYFPTIIKNLNTHRLFYHDQDKSSPWSRVIIEKPFGRDLESAEELQKCIEENLEENSVYRIDHYLGKETVQNILTIRFANMLFESCWNAQYIDHVQISLGEAIGIGTRGNLFEQSGMLRDMVQNHMMQLLCLLTMEPPAIFNSEEIKKEKIKILEKILPFSQDLIVRGQYGQGTVQGVSVLGYREEENVSPDSLVETYVALKVFINNPRWLGVPFYLRAGKRLEKRSTDISIIFKKPPYTLFSSEACRQCPLENDLLIIRIQPDEGVALQFNCKVPGTNNTVRPVKMDFRYDSYFHATTAEAYERLLCDCILGERTLFTSWDEVRASWKLFTPVLKAWEENTDISFPNYPAGSSGPKEADQLLLKDGRYWRPL